MLVFVSQPLALLPSQLPQPALQLHTPPEQVPLLQTFPQPPQLLGSVAVLMQVPPHNVVPAGHAHAPFWQVFPPVQALLHAPQ